MYLLPIVLTNGFSAHVAPQQPVKKGDILASQKASALTTVNVAQILGVSPKKAHTYLRKQVGDQVVRGEALAIKPGVLGLSGERIICEVDGTITDIMTDSGEVTIHTKQLARPSSTTIHSPVEGVITVCDNEKIVIQTVTPVIVAETGHGQAGNGELVVLHPDGTNEIQYFHLDANLRGRVIVGGKFGRDSLTKALGLRVAGILATEVDPDDIAYIQKRSNMPLLLIKKEHYPYFLTVAGKVVYIDGMSKSIVF